MGRPKGTPNRKTAVKSSVPKVKYEEQEKVYYRCYRCGKLCEKQEGLFPKVRSAMYAGNNGYLPWCNTCVNGIYEHYLEVFGNEEEAVKRTCLRLDVYYHPMVTKMTRGGSTTSSKMKRYISKANLVQVKGVSYDDTLDEEYNLLAEPPQPLPDDEEVIEQAKGKEPIQGNSEDNNSSAEQNKKPKKKHLELFGPGYSPDVYPILNSHYDDLVTMAGGELDLVQAEYAKNMALLKYQMQKSIQENSGKDIHSLINSYKSLLDASGIKREQKSNEACDPIGMVIADIEQYTPAEYFADKKVYHDADGIKEYIERFLKRPFKNLFSNNKAEPDGEFWINDNDVENGDYIEDT